ncbi:hypothetical protein BD560DRAFT_412130 [Blakeslea trispora]|nr:hypothetical protein BD560DRAFT_412130 [Blakeslea trispora]
MEHVLTWDENKVTKWMSSIGYASYEKQFKEQGITGDVLVNLDHESLQDLSVVTVGQRMDILKNIYQLKILYRVPVNEWDYIPPSVIYETEWVGQNGMTDYRKIEAAFQERDARIKRLTEDMTRLTTDVNLLRDELLKKSSKSTKSSFPYQKHANSPTKPSPTIADYHLTHHNGYYQHDEKSNVMINDGGAIKVYGDKISKVELEPESSKNVRLLLDDPTSKVIISALRKYNVNSDWQQYALWIQYGQADNMQERALGYDEKPLRISQKLKETKQNPVFVLKHVKDNKPFIPPNMVNHPRTVSKQQQKSKNNTLDSMDSKITNQDNSHSENNSNNNNNTNHNVTSGRVGFEVVIPVISSSISTPTPNTAPAVLQSKGKQQPVYNNELGLDDSIVSAIFSINNSAQ